MLSSAFPETTPTVVYGIGASKCGTSWLYEMLRRHDEIGVPSLKEGQYWDWRRAPHATNPLIHRRLGQYALPGMQILASAAGLISSKARLANNRYRHYERMYSASYYDHSAYLEYLRSENPECKVLADISPGYALLSAQTYAEMAALVPDTKFIFIMRDPIERLWSSVRFSMRREKLSPDERQCLAERKFREILEDRHHPLLRKSTYQETITNLEQTVPDSSVLYLFFERLFSQESMNQVWEFLGVGRGQIISEFVANKGRETPHGLPGELRSSARHNLRDTYDFVGEKFAGDLPQGWTA